MGQRGEEVTHAVRFTTTVRADLAHVSMAYKTPSDGFWRHGGELLVPPPIAEVLQQMVAAAGHIGSDVDTPSTRHPEVSE